MIFFYPWVGEEFAHNERLLVLGESQPGVADVVDAGGDFITRPARPAFGGRVRQIFNIEIATGAIADPEPSRPHRLVCAIPRKRAPEAGDR